MGEREKNLKVLLIGNPNAGKSTLFNRLTGAHARVGNWHGVTVGVKEGVCRLGQNGVNIYDLPGIYSLDTMTMEEGITKGFLSQNKDAFLLLVAECATLPRALKLFAQLAKDRACALVLTKRKQFEKRGGKLNERMIEKELKIPLFCAEKCKKSHFIAFLEGAITQNKRLERGELSPCAYTSQTRVFLRREKLFCNQFFCLSFFFATLIATFYLTFAPNLLGDFLGGKIEEFFSRFLYQKAQDVSSPVLRGFLGDGILKSVGSVLCFLPQITLLFACFTAMEESGVLSRIAMHTDGFLSKIGLSGRAVFCLLMGFGCTASAILTTRGLEQKQMQKRVILALPYLSCSAKLPVFLTLTSSFFVNPFYAVVLLYALGIGISLLVSCLMKGEEERFLLELAPLQLPNIIFLAKSLYFQIKQFIIKLATVILAFFILSWLLSSFSFSFTYCRTEESMLASICAGLKYLFAPIGCNDWKIAYAALSGLVAKENVAGALTLFYGGFPYSAQSAFAFSVFILTCSPCVSAISATAKELGVKRAIFYALLQTGSALLLSYLTYFLLLGGVVFVLPALAVGVAIFITGKKKSEKIRRKRRKYPQKFHR